MRLLGALLAVTTGCSFALPDQVVQRPSVIEATHAEPTCRDTLPIVDTALGASLIGAGAGVGALTIDHDRGAATIAIAGALVAGGIAFLVSARHGHGAVRTCRGEQLAMRERQDTQADREVPAVATCEQRRLDMYSRAVTGANELQRVRLLATLPTCEERPERERAWALTRKAALAAGAGQCDEIEAMALEVYQLDIVLHDVVLLGDIEIKHCLQRRVL